MSDSNLGSSAQAAYASLRKKSNLGGNITVYTGIEAIFDAFGVAVDCIERFKASYRPTMLVVLPMIYRTLQKLHEVSNGEKGLSWRKTTNVAAI